MTLRGVILAGGKGTRLGELTKVTNKHLLPVGPYPMVYHPLKKLVGAGIKEVLLVSGTEHMGDFVELLGSGRSHQCRAHLPRAGRGGRHRAGPRAWQSSSARIAAVSSSLETTSSSTRWAPCCKPPTPPRSAPGWPSNRCRDPGRYGVAELRGDRIIGIEEKPAKPKSDHAVAGIYVYPPDVFEVVKTLKPSHRGELEITDVNRHYLEQGRLGYSTLNGYWTDAGTLDSLIVANELVRDAAPRF